MRTVQLYVDNQRLDLFKDEEIRVNSSVKTVGDISKVQTDFSQTFTVPASPNNNAILGHYYNNDLNTINANERIRARIEINHIPFRKGKIQIEGAEVKDNQASSYRITFYGDVTTLKDLFGSDKLGDLDYSGLTHTYTGANVQTGITSTSDLDVRYPLISSDRLWNYGDADPNDISDVNYPIDFNELFPALKDKKILEAIEDTYGVTFTGLFLNNKRFTNSFTWWKNQDTPEFTLKPERIPFNTAGTSGPLYNSFAYVQYKDPYTLIPSGATPVDLEHWIMIYLVPDFTGTYYLDIVNNSNSVQNTVTVNGVAGQPQLIPVLNGQVNQWGLDDYYYYNVRSTSAGNIYGAIRYRYIYSYIDSGVTYFDEDDTDFLIPTFTLTNTIDWNTSAPDITVYDWLKGTIQQFNLTCFPLDDDLTFEMEPLEDWYNAGDEVDITPYTDTKSIKYDRISPYKEISFEWQKSKSFLNVAFQSLYKRQYGSLKSSFPYDGGKFSIKLPFENLLFQKFTGENLQVAYSLEEGPDFKQYTPKPVKLYLHEEETTDVDFYFDNDTSVVNITSYVPMGQDLEYNTENFSMNWGADQSSLLNLNIENSLYRTYYQTYIQNMFSQKSRKVKLKAMLPLPMLTKLSLDDAIILRDKKYRIDTMKTNLTTGLVDLVLVSDWTVVRKTIKPPVVADGGGTIVIPIKPVKPTKGGKVNIGATLETSFTTPTPAVPTDVTADTDLSIVVPSNGTGATRTNTYPLKYYSPDGTLLETVYVVIKQLPAQDKLLTEGSANLLTEKLDYILL